MTQVISYMEAVIGADITNFRRGMRDVRNEMGVLSDTVGGMGEFGRILTFGVTVPLVSMGAVALKTASEFDAAMRNTNSILGLSEQQFASLSDEILKFGSNTRAGGIGTAEAFYEIVSAGVTDTARAMAIMETSTKVAEAGLADLQGTTNAITATMSAYNLETSQAARVGNVWTRMVQLGVGSLNDFLSNSQKVLPLSNELGVSLEDMGATLAFLSQGGGGARKAETAYAMMLSNLIKPTEAMQEAFARLDVSTGDELIDKFGSVGAAIKALKDNAESPIDFNKMFSKTGLEAALRLVNNYDQLTAAQKEFLKGLDTATITAWDEQAKSMAMTFDLLMARLQGAAIVIGTQLWPFVQPIIDGFGQMALNVSNLSPEVLRLGIVFAGLVAVIGPVLWLLGSLVSIPALLVAGISTLAVAFATDFGGIRTTVETTIAPILEDLAAVKTGLDTFFDTLFEEFETPPDTASLVQPLVDAVETQTITIPVEAGMTLSEIYASNEELQSAFSREDFIANALTQLEISDPRYLREGDVLRFDIGIAPDIKWMYDQATSQTSSMDFFGDLAGKMKGGEQDNPLAAKIQAAVDAAWPQIEIALASIRDKVLDWVKNTFVPSLDTFGGDLLGGLADSITNNSEYAAGENPITNAISKLLEGNITDALNTIKPGLGDSIGDAFNISAEELFPKISAGLDNLKTAIQMWVTNVGLPSLGNILGNLVARIPSIINDALRTMNDAIANTDVAGESLANGMVVNANVISPSIFDGFIAGFMQGFAEAAQQIDWKATIAGLFGNLIEALAKFNPYAVLLAQLGVDTTWLDGISEGFTDAIVNLDVGKIASEFWDSIVKGINDFIKDLSIQISLPSIQINAPIEWPTGKEMIEQSALNDPNSWTPAGSFDINAPNPELDALYAMADNPTISTAAQTAGQAVASTIVTSMADELANAATTGAIDPTAVVDTMITPISNAVTTSFGEEGTATVAFATFVDTMSTGTSGVQSATSRLAVGTSLSMALMATAFTIQVAIINTALTGLIGLLNAAKGAATGLAGALGSIAGGGQPIAGARAGGGDVFGGRSYLVGERGPELFTPGQSGTIISNSALRGAQAGGGQTVVQNSIQVVEANDVDAILFELRRRGIALA